MSEMAPPVEIKPLKVCWVCGKKAYTLEDLEAFVKNKYGTYGHTAQCRKCNSIERAKAKYRVWVIPNTGESLRKCIKCGLVAHTEEELNLFLKMPNAKYGRQNKCKKCNCKPKREPLTIEKAKSDKTRNKLLIEKWKKPLFCYFCRKKITILQGQKPESIHIHSLDRNHKNWDFNNKVPSHNSCHINFHANNQLEKTKRKRSKTMLGKNNHEWKHGKYVGNRVRWRDNNE